MLFWSIFNQADLTVVLAKEFKKKLGKMGISHSVIISTTLIDLQEIPSENFCKVNFEKKRLVFLSRVEKAKGIYETIEAFKILKKVDNSIMLDIAGDGPELESVKKAYANIEGIKFHGYLGDDEKYKLLSTSTLFVFPSYSEGMPNCVLEAMACGLPVITTPVGGIKDFFLNGLNGYLLDPNKPENLAKQILQILSEQKRFQCISSYNFNYARQYFSSQKAIVFLKSINHAALWETLDKLKSDWYE
ncbi:MAG: glycosyltransferase family 4 protein [Desulfamplus sp.]|nr:glycosyltransferase family 4 protein [Desulfamplus sp.]